VDPKAEGKPVSSSWSLENVLRLRDEIRGRERVLQQTEARNESFHAAAAVLSSFTIDPAVHVGEAGANLAADSIPVVGGKSGRWMLKNQVRTRVLSRLSSVAALREALVSTRDRPTDEVQQAIDAWLFQRASSLDEQTPQQLAATLQVVDWFSGTELHSVLPSADDVRLHIERQAVLSPLRSLVGEHFRGRKIQLDTLDRYVDSTNEPTHRPPVLIFGPGGMGKSTLVARFVLDRLDTLPVVYLDCDRPGLIAEEPLTLLSEAVRQLGLQVATHLPTAQRLRDTWIQLLTRELSADNGGRATALGRTRMLSEFGVFVSDLQLADRKILFVIDTFEEVQHRSRVLVREIFEFLSELQQLIPGLRPVIAGRNAIPDLKWEPLEIAELEMEAAEAFLEALKVESKPMREVLARLLRGNPLSLRLAAEVIKIDKSINLENVKDLIDDTEVQGLLYGRILGHLPTEQLRRLAHPGLILRRIDLDILKHVLAGPCELELADDDEARELFESFRQELSLVIPDGDGVRHRPDVRRVMLKPLKRNKAKIVRDIQKAAVEYYESKDDVTSRAEEIYHRLSLGQTAAIVEHRWISGVEDLLRSAVDELEGPARTFLATRLGIEIYQEDWDAVDQASWESYAANLVNDLLRLDRPLEAVQVLRRRTARQPESPLYWFHAQALRRSGQNLEAQELSRQGIVNLLRDTEWEASEQHGQSKGSIAVKLMNWFAGPQLAAPPSAEDVRVQLQWLRLLDPLYTLAGQSFSGRRSELATIAEYVAGGVLSRGLGPALTRPPLLIHGVGGTGKSTLIARFALDRVDQAWLVFVDCDGLRWEPDKPLKSLDALLDYAAYQLGLQIPKARNRDRALRELPSIEQGFRRFVEDLPLENRPLLFVLDNFEAIATGSAHLVNRIYAFVTGLQAEIRQVRTVFVSRVALRDFLFERLEVGRLDDESADAFLTAEGITSAEVRRKIIQLIDGNPYSLRLAVTLIREEGPSAIASIEARVGVVPELLFQRILDRIFNPEIRRLAFVGLLVRRITPGVLREVIAGPAGITVGSDQRARELLRELRDQVSIFTQELDILRPRPDIRRLLLNPVQQREPALASAVHKAAVKYYARHDEVVSRAEEIYHRLALGQPSETVDGRWKPGVESELRSAVNDLAGGSRAYLAARLDVEVDDVDWSSADQTTWETHVQARSQRLLEAKRFVEALDLIRQRSTRLPRSALVAIEVRVLLGLDVPREALQVARDGLRRWPEDPLLPELIEQCKATVGIDASIQEQVDSGLQMSGQQVSYHIDDGVSISEIVHVLIAALPNMTDLRLVLDAAGVDNKNIDLSGPYERVMTDVVMLLRDDGRLDEVLATAESYASKSFELREFLIRRTARFERRALDPLTNVMPGMRVFFNRHIVREFMHELGSGVAPRRILAVEGPAGSGKSYTSVLVSHLARTVGTMTFVLVRLEPQMTAEDVARSIHESLSWRWEDIGQIADIVGIRRTRMFSDGIRAKARRLSSTVILFFDDAGQIRDDVSDLIADLARRVEPLALVVAGFDRRRLPADAQPRTMIESIGNLTEFDIREGMLRIAGELNLPAQITTQGISYVFEKLVPGESFNRRANGLASEVVEGWIRESPVTRWNRQP
jgi:AAA ATPase domain